MAKISKRFEFDAGHRLTLHKGKCFNVHGHRYQVIITINGNINENGMVKDFGELKRIKNWIDENRDHAYIHNSTDKYGILIKNDGLKTYDMGMEPTAENMAKYLFNLVKKNENLLQSIEVYETPTSSAIFNG